MRIHFKKLAKFFCIVAITILPAKQIIAQRLAEVTEHLGSQLPLDVKLVNSKGEQVILKDLIKKSTIIDFVYYKCAGICTPLMIEVSDVVEKSDYTPGKDYDIISISIDQNETPKMAAEKKRAMIGLSGYSIPDTSWYFLTADSASIYTLTNSAGFGFTRTKGGFLHKGVLIIVDKTGKIVQYLKPGYVQESGNFQILPSEFDMAIRTAQKGKITQTIAKVLQTCFTYIPHGRMVFILIMIFIVSMLIILGIVLIIKKANLNKSQKKIEIHKSINEP